MIDLFHVAAVLLVSYLVPLNICCNLSKLSFKIVEVDQVNIIKGTSLGFLICKFDFLSCNLQFRGEKVFTFISSFLNTGVIL